MRSGYGLFLISTCPVDFLSICNMPDINVISAAKHASLRPRGEETRLCRTQVPDAAPPQPSALTTNLEDGGTPAWRETASSPGPQVSGRVENRGRFILSIQSPDGLCAPAPEKQADRRGPPPSARITARGETRRDGACCASVRVATSGLRAP